MANIKTKDINQLSSWDKKELRKLRMVIRNRISSLEAPGKVKDLPESHPLFNMQIGACKDLLEKVISAEKH